ncbi:MAG TPA: response regulator [Flavobacterium sp.]|jgi:signal transduction histidine kinase/ActR/RegA family two-component response regulator
MPRSLTNVLLLFLLFAAAAHSQEEEGYNRKEIIRLTDQADDYLDESKFRESLLYSREALKRAISIRDYYLMATAYNTIAGNFDELSEFDKAINNYEKALYYAGKAKNDTMKGWLNNNLANVYFFEKKQYNKGIYYYQKAIDVAEKTKDTTRSVFTHLNVALAYFEIGQYDKGYPHLQYINTYHPRHGKPGELVYLNMLNGIYAGHIGNRDQANTFFQKAIDAGIQHKEVYDLSYTYQEYAKFLNSIGDYKNAYKYLTLFDKMKDEIYDSTKLKKAEVEGINLEIDEYKRALDKISREKEIQSQSLRKSKIIVVLFIAVLLVLLLLLYTMYRNNTFRKKSNLELTQTNAELKVAKEKAEEASQLKSQFVSTISHELRTPLYGVVGITNMISDEHKELAASPHLQSLKFSAKYLLSLVNDILQINKIEENKIRLENTIFNLSDEIATIENSLQFIALRNENTISMKIDPAIPEFLIGDKLRLSQIFMNLVSNALKFTNNGEVKVTADLDRFEENIYYIRFTVTDNGIGIAKADQTKIFEKFVQIERKEDDYQGTGLGLSIVQKLITLFGSEIHLESAENVGTAFTFTIGFEYDQKKTIEIIHEIEVDMTSAQLFEVLVVEDNKINQMVTRKIMENHNFKCVVVDDGFAALDLLQRRKFDIILMDINMPVINGFETTKKLRALGIETPVVALTAFDREEVVEEALASGMNDVISKPFEPIRLFQILTRQISKKLAD